MLEARSGLGFCAQNVLTGWHCESADLTIRWTSRLYDTMNIKENIFLVYTDILMNKLHFWQGNKYVFIRTSTLCALPSPSINNPVILFFLSFPICHHRLIQCETGPSAHTSSIHLHQAQFILRKYRSTAPRFHHLSTHQEKYPVTN